MKHTQGNWEFTKKEGNYIVHSYQSNNGCLAIVGTGLYNSDPLLFDEAEANARLIAAAPELLKALQNLVDFIDTYGIRDGNGKSHLEDLGYLEEQKLAIQKATQP